jgi:hypothetical protein
MNPSYVTRSKGVNFANSWLRTFVFWRYADEFTKQSGAGTHRPGAHLEQARSRAVQGDFEVKATDGRRAP